MNKIFLAIIETLSLVGIMFNAIHLESWKELGIIGTLFFIVFLTFFYSVLRWSIIKEVE